MKHKNLVSSRGNLKRNFNLLQRHGYNKGLKEHILRYKHSIYKLSLVTRAVYGMGQVGYGFWELYNGSGRVGLTSMIARVRSRLEIYAGKLGQVTGNPHFWVRKFTAVYEGQSRKCEKHLHAARFYTSNKTQSSKMMIKMVKTSIWASFLSP